MNWITRRLRSWQARNLRILNRRAASAARMKGL